LHEAAQEILELPQRCDVVGAIIVWRDIGENVVQLIAPYVAQTRFADGLA
jgi:hypothetical protein